MNAIYLRKHIDSGLVDAIPELGEVLGTDVDIIVVPAQASGNAPLETLETFLGDAAHRPPPTHEEMAELRAAAATDPILASALDFAESVEIDVDAIVQHRANSRG